MEPNIETTGGAIVGAPEVGGGAPLESTQATPTVRDFTDDDLVRIPGQEQPVKYGELYKRLQADHTKKSQEVSKLQKALEKQQKEWDTTRAQQESYLKNLAASLLNKKETPTEDPFRALESLSFLDGRTAAQLARTIQTQGIQPIIGAIQERDQIIRTMYQNMLQLQNVVQELNSRRADQDFDGKISKYIKDLDLPEEVADLVKEVYLAYEGDDLDDVFPDIMRSRWEQITAAVNAANKKRAEAARKKPFVPGKGGDGRPGGRVGLTGKESAAQAADILWEQLQGGENT